VYIKHPSTVAFDVLLSSIVSLQQKINRENKVREVPLARDFQLRVRDIVYVIDPW
jgi:hypothetical protein